MSIMMISNTCKAVSSVRFDSFSRITDAGVIEVANRCLNITNLALSYTFITDDSLQALSLLPLRNLNIKSCRRVSEQGLLFLFSKLGSLEKLNLSNTKGVTDGVIDVIEANCKKLELLMLSSADITEISLVSILNLRNLQHLSLNFCRFSDFSIFTTSEHVKKLKSLSLAGNENLTDFDINCLSKSSDSLYKLNIQKCSLLTDESIKSLCINLKRIKYLDLKYLNISNLIIQYLPFVSKTIKLVKISELKDSCLLDNSFPFIRKFKVLLETDGKSSIIKFKK